MNGGTDGFLFFCARKVCNEIVKKYAKDKRHRLMKEAYVWKGPRDGWVARQPSDASVPIATRGDNS